MQIAYTETPAEVAIAIFNILSRSLQINNFCEMEPEAQNLTLDEVENAAEKPCCSIYQ